MPRRNGAKKSVLNAGGEVNTTVKFLKDGIAASSYNGSAKDGKGKKAVLIPKKKIKDDVIKNINKCKYGLMLKYFIR